MRESTLEGRVVSLRVPSKGTNYLLVESFRGVEKISQPYRFELTLLSRETRIDSAEFVDGDRPVSLVLKRAVPKTDGRGYDYEPHRIHGILASFSQRGQVKLASGVDVTVYDAVLVPRLWALSLSVRTRIFQNMSVFQIAEAVLGEHGLRAGADFSMEGVAKDDEVKHPKREFVVQYKESDLNFVSRLLEHEGCAYHFVQEGEEDGVEKVVFTEGTDRFPAIPGSPPIQYRTAGAGGALMGWVVPDGAMNVVARHDRKPKEVILTDYNYRKADLGLARAAKPRVAGGGLIHEHGDHYRTKEQGDYLAKIRAQEVECRERVFEGEGNSKLMRAGYTFRLTGHYREDFNQEYLIEEVEHEARQDLEGGTHEDPHASYRNRFVCLPIQEKDKALVYRPPRVTPKPRVEGPINARVDAGDDFASLDERGRYRVRFPFDLRELEKGKASRPVRKIEPYGGPGYGMHFPLHSGVEVLMGFVNGDPDRPIILGAVHDSSNSHVVGGGNRAQCALTTGGNNKLVIDDDIGRITLSTPSAQTFVKMGEDVGSSGIHWRTNDDCVIETDGFFEFQTKGNHQTFVYEGNLQIVVEKGNRLLVVKAGGDEVQVQKDQRIFVHGNQESHIDKDCTVTVDGKYELHVKDESIWWKYAKTTDWYIANTFEAKLAATETFHGGATVSVFAGKATSAKAGLVIDGYLARRILFNKGRLIKRGKDSIDFQDKVTAKYDSYSLDVTKGLGDICLKNGPWKMDIWLTKGVQLSGPGKVLLLLKENNARLQSADDNNISAARGKITLKNPKCKLQLSGPTIDLDAKTVTHKKGALKVK